MGTPEVGEKQWAEREISVNQWPGKCLDQLSSYKTILHHNHSVTWQNILDFYSRK